MPPPPLFLHQQKDIIQKTWHWTLDGARPTLVPRWNNPRPPKIFFSAKHGPLYRFAPGQGNVFEYAACHGSSAHQNFALIVDGFVGPHLLTLFCETDCMDPRLEPVQRETVGDSAVTSDMLERHVMMADSFAPYQVRLPANPQHGPCARSRAWVRDMCACVATNHGYDHRSGAACRDRAVISCMEGTERRPVWHLAVPVAVLQIFLGTTSPSVKNGSVVKPSTNFLKKIFFTR